MNKLVLNYPEEQRISTFLLDFFWNELNVARKAKDHEIWLVSPWIKNSNFELSLRGPFSNLWPEFTKSSISLKHILNKFLEYNSQINIVCYPPHCLIHPQNFLNFHEFKMMLEEMDNLLATLDGQKDNVTYVASKDKVMREKMSQTISKMKQKAVNLRSFLEGFRQSCKGHLDVLTFVNDLVNFSPNKVNVYFNYKLHAKIILGKYGGFIGSANITYSGFNYNDEILLYTTDKKVLATLREVCHRLAYSPDDWWKRAAEDYSARYQYRRILGEQKLTEIMNDETLPEDIRETLEIIGLLQ